MDYLLDTHTIIWFFDGDKKLSKGARAIIEDANNSKIVSIASIWEIAIKVKLNKLNFKRGLEHFFLQIEANGFKIIHLSFEHAMKVSALELLHRDPFDRLMVAQAMTEGLTIITKDGFIQEYDIKTLW